MSVGPAEILIILIVGLLVFGPQRLPEVGRQVGSALRELRRMQDTVRGELDMVLHPEHGTSSSGVPTFEPADHSAIDPSAIGAATLDADADAFGDVTSVEIPRADEPGFSGPPDSFI